MTKSPVFSHVRVPAPARLRARSQAHAGTRTRTRATALSLLLALALSGCTVFAPAGNKLSAGGTTARDGIVLELAGASIALPAGAVAAGTAVAASLAPASGLDAGTPPSAGAAESAAPPASELLPQAGGRLTVTVGAELAEGTAMTVAMDVAGLPQAEGFTTSAATLALAHLPSGAVEPELLRAAWTPAGSGGTITAEVSAGGTFWAVHADIPALLAATATGLQAGGTAQKPECQGKSAAAGGMTFTASNAPGTWTCLREHNDRLMVALAAESAMPMRLATAEKRSGTTVLDPQAVAPYLHQILKPLLAQHKDLGAAMPGAVLEHETAAAGVEHHEWELRPYPAMFLLSHLTTLVQATMDADMDPAAIDASRTAQCTAPLLEGAKEHVALAESWAVPFAKSFMECIAGSLEISPRMDVLLGAANAGPAQLAAHAVGLWNGLPAGEAATLSIKGEMAWTTYSGTLNNAKFSFEHPVAWTVMDGSVNQQFAFPNSVVVYDHAGAKMADLQVIDVFGISGPGDMAAVEEMASMPGRATLSTGKTFRTETLAMDLTNMPKVREKNRWGNNVTLSMGLTATDSNREAVRLPNMMSGMVEVETGVKHRLTQQSSRLVSFGQTFSFESMDAAREFSKSAGHAVIQKMLASFKG